MFIGMDQLTRLDLATKHLNFAPPPHGRGVAASGKGIGSRWKGLKLRRYPQGSAEWAVESAKRVLRSAKATPQQETAAQEILKAASQGSLEVHVVRTSHVLGEPTAAVLEQSVKTSEKSIGLAKEALRSLERGATQGGSNAFRTGTEAVEDLGKSADGATKAAGNGGRVLRGAAKAAVVVGIGVDVGLRANDAANVEREFANGKITQHDRVVKHARNAGGFVGGWTGAYGGAESGAIAGGAVGAMFGGVGAPIGAPIGAAIGGIGG
jgi:hypothetical protein